MDKRTGILQRGLDKDICKVITKLQDNLGATTDLSVTEILEAIRKSNSSLSRKPKLLLQSGIERVLDAMQQQETIQPEEEMQADVSPNESSTNLMNRKIVRSWGNANTSKERASIESPMNRLQNEQQTIASQYKSTRKHARSSSTSAEGQRASKRKPAREAPTVPTAMKLADIGGMDTEIKWLQKRLMLPLLRPERYVQRGVKIPRGILFHGPPGCGKTMLCEAFAAELGLPFLPISAPSMVSGMSGESEKQLRTHFERAISLAPCLMFIDEIDAITPKRDNAQREMEKRIVAQLLTCMDDLALEKTGGKPVIVLAATNRPDSLDPALRRPGRFDYEINIGAPSPAVREQILRVQTRRSDISADVDFTKLATMTSGFVGADLEGLVTRAGDANDERYLEALEELSRTQTSNANNVMVADQYDDVDLENPAEKDDRPPSETVKCFRAMRDVLLSPLQPDSSLNVDAITMADFLTALPTIQPSTRREGFATIPDVTWDSIGALHDIRHKLKRAIVQPIQFPEAYLRFGGIMPAGVLLYGPPGNGKTLLAKAVANESKANFISVKGPDLLNKYVGESERAVRQVFQRARSSMPCVIFFDEVDALTPHRDTAGNEATARVVNTMLIELDGEGSSRAGIHVIAATNRLHMIDSALLRPGRFGTVLHVGPPKANERVEILRTHMRGRPCEKIGTDSKQFEQYAEGCVGFSGADLGRLVFEAIESAVSRGSQELEWQDLETARQTVKPDQR